MVAGFILATDEQKGANASYVSLSVNLLPYSMEEGEQAAQVDVQYSSKSLILNGHGMYIHFLEINRSPQGKFSPSVSR